MSTLVVSKVAVVNGNIEILERLAEMIDGDSYEVVFLEMGEQPLQKIKEQMPNLVIVCMHVDDGLGFQLLNMLSSDSETRELQILTCVTGIEGDSPEAVPQYEDEASFGLHARSPASRMN